MNAVLWVMQGLLAAMFVMSGFGKISNTKEQHIADRHIKPGSSVIPIRILGVLEWLGCIGIIVPLLTGIMPLLTPVSAVCFGLIMIAALINHVLRKEYKMLPLLTTILLLAAIVAYFRFSELTR
jgi:uncharacterized membrane protein YphA (DoxX/SURF4 family)